MILCEMKSEWESVEVGMLAAIPNVGEFHPISFRPEQNKKTNLLGPYRVVTSP